MNYSTNSPPSFLSIETKKKYFELERVMYFRKLAAAESDFLMRLPKSKELEFFTYIGGKC